MRPVEQARAVATVMGWATRKVSDSSSEIAITCCGFDVTAHEHNFGLRICSLQAIPPDLTAQILSLGGDAYHALEQSLVEVVLGTRSAPYLVRQDPANSRGLTHVGAQQLLYCTNNRPIDPQRLADGIVEVMGSQRRLSYTLLRFLAGTPLRQVASDTGYL